MPQMRPGEHAADWQWISGRERRIRFPVCMHCVSLHAVHGQRYTRADVPVAHQLLDRHELKPLGSGPDEQGLPNVARPQGFVWIIPAQRGTATSRPPGGG